MYFFKIYIYTLSRWWTSGTLELLRLPARSQLTETSFTCCLPESEQITNTSKYNSGSIHTQTVLLFFLRFVREAEGREELLSCTVRKIYHDKLCMYDTVTLQYDIRSRDTCIQRRKSSAEGSPKNPPTSAPTNGRPARLIDSNIGADAARWSHLRFKGRSAGPTEGSFRSGGGRGRGLHYFVHLHLFCGSNPLSFFSFFKPFTSFNALRISYFHIQYSINKRAIFLRYGW